MVDDWFWLVVVGAKDFVFVWVRLGGFRWRFLDVASRLAMMIVSIVVE